MAQCYKYSFQDLSICVGSESVSGHPKFNNCDNTNLHSAHVQYNNDEVQKGSVQNAPTTCSEKEPRKDFDRVLQTLWDNAKRESLFRYPLPENLPTKILPGRFQFVAQLNRDRAEKRRKPQEIQSLSQPFNHEQFNFNRVSPREIILYLQPWWDSEEGEAICGSNSDDAQEANKRHAVLINVSPLEYGNVLLVPFLRSNQPQRITLQGLRCAVEMMLLSRSPDFRLGFNSLCAYASVNHHHYHAYYLKQRLYLEFANLSHLAGPCKETPEDYPASGFAFVLESSSESTDNSTSKDSWQLQFQLSLESFLNDAFKLITLLQNKGVAHNLFITRGSIDSKIDHFNNLRLFIWARASSFGSKESAAFNPALCELGGHFPIKNDEAYETLTEAFICAELQTVCKDTFLSVRKDVIRLFNRDDELINDIDC